MKHCFLDTSVTMCPLTRTIPSFPGRPEPSSNRFKPPASRLSPAKGCLSERSRCSCPLGPIICPVLQICRLRCQLLGLDGLKLPNWGIYFRALALYASVKPDFVDCLEVAHMERLKLPTIASFDRDFDRIPGARQAGARIAADAQDG